MLEDAGLVMVQHSEQRIELPVETTCMIDRLNIKRFKALSIGTGRERFIVRRDINMVRHGRPMTDLSDTKNSQKW